jgi:hypothetical protein
VTAADDNVVPLRADDAGSVPAGGVDGPADEGDAEALLALRSAQHGYQAAADASGRVRLPSLTDFIS